MKILGVYKLEEIEQVKVDPQLVIVDVKSTGLEDSCGFL